MGASPTSTFPKNMGQGGSTQAINGNRATALMSSPYQNPATAPSGINAPNGANPANAGPMGSNIVLTPASRPATNAPQTGLFPGGRFPAKFAALRAKLKLAKQVPNDRDKAPTWEELSKEHKQTGPLSGAAALDGCGGGHVHRRKKMAEEGITSELVIAFVDKAGDRLTSELCKQAAEILPDSTERDELLKLANLFGQVGAGLKTLWNGGAKNLLGGVYDAATSKGLGRHVNPRGFMNTAGNMLQGGIGGGAVGTALDWGAGALGYEDTNFALMGGALGGMAGTPFARLRLNQAARAMRSPMNTMGNLMAGVKPNYRKGSGGIMDHASSVVRNLQDPWRVTSPTTSGKARGVDDFSGKEVDRKVNIGERVSGFLNPLHNWGSSGVPGSRLSPVSRAGRMLAIPAAIEGGQQLVDSVGNTALKPFYGYNPLSPKATGEHFATQKIDEFAKGLGYSDAEQAMKSPLVQALQAYNNKENGGVIPAIMAGWNAMTPNEKARLLAAAGGGISMIGALGSAATGNYGAAAGLGALGAAGLGYGAFGGSNPMAELNKMPDDYKNNIYDQMSRQMSPDQWSAMSRPQQMEALQMMMSQQAQQGGQNELQRAGGE